LTRIKFLENHNAVCHNIKFWLICLEEVYENRAAAPKLRNSGCPVKLEMKMLTK
jgi:hypothetical protein